MSRTPSYGSATIHLFRLRALPSSRQHREGTASVIDLCTARRPAAAVDSGWYHEAAISDAALPGQVCVGQPRRGV